MKPLLIGKKGGRNRARNNRREKSDSEKFKEAISVSAEDFFIKISFETRAILSGRYAVDKRRKRRQFFVFAIKIAFDSAQDEISISFVLDGGQNIILWLWYNVEPKAEERKIFSVRIWIETRLI